MESESEEYTEDEIIGGVIVGYAYCVDCIGIETSFDEYEASGAIPVMEGDIGIELMECQACHGYLEG